MAFFLSLTGITGTILAFEDEINEGLNRDLYFVDWQGAALSPDELIIRVEQQVPEIRVAFLETQARPGRTLEATVYPRIDPATGEPYPIDYLTLHVNPATGHVVGKRNPRGCCTRQSLVPVIYDLHEHLWASRIGKTTLGIIALLWLIDCFVGVYLTMPRGRFSFASWAPSWKLKRKPSFIRRNLDLHRSVSLWVWPLFLALALSSVFFNLNPVFRAGVEVFSDITPNVFSSLEQRPLNRMTPPPVSFNEAAGTARRLAEREHWQDDIYRIHYQPSYGVYMVIFGEDKPVGLGFHIVYIDGNDGSVLGTREPGKGTFADVLVQMQFPLHSGQIAGLTGRVVIAISGILISLVSITGVVIWWRKQKARRFSMAHSNISVEENRAFRWMES